MGSKVILVIEDDDVIRETLEQALEMEGYQVFTASNGKEGMELLPKIPRPQLILLDLMMPVMNGWQFVDAINENPELAAIPVVVVSAFGERAKAVRAKEFVKKPLDLDTLLRTVEQYSK